MIEVGEVFDDRNTRGQKPMMRLERRCDEVSLVYLVGVRTLHAHGADAPLEEQSDCAGVETLLASDVGSFIPGQALYVDGGFLAAVAGTCRRERAWRPIANA